MPQSNKSKDNHVVENGSRCRQPSLRASPSKWNVDVSNDPAIVTSMPASPEGHCGGIIRETAKHILWWIDAVHQCPKAEESKWYKKLEPQDVQVEIGQKRQLGWRIIRPVGV